MGSFFRPGWSRLPGRLLRPPRGGVRSIPFRFVRLVRGGAIAVRSTRRTLGAGSVRFPGRGRLGIVASALIELSRGLVVRVRTAARCGDLGGTLVWSGFALCDAVAPVAAGGAVIDGVEGFTRRGAGPGAGFKRDRGRTTRGGVRGDEERIA